MLKLTADFSAGFLKGQACFTRAHRVGVVLFSCNKHRSYVNISSHCFWEGIMSSNTNEIYGVFTLERQDLVDLSARIAQCVPKGFLKDKDKPVVIAVDGSVRCGKKIVADYGRAAVLDAVHEDIAYPTYISPPEEPVPLTRFQKIKNFCRSIIAKEPEVETEPEAVFDGLAVMSNGKSLDCRGVGEYDEYVSSNIESDKIDISFINMAWGSGYSFGNEYDVEKCYQKHIDQRQAGGLIYAHNVNLSNVLPDIEIKLERGTGHSCLNGQARSCRDVGHALVLAVGGGDSEDFEEWGRFVSVQFNNAALNADGAMLKMLKDEFGFCALKDIPVKLMHAPELQGANLPDGDGRINIKDFPLIKKHTAYLHAARRHNDECEKAGEQDSFELVVNTPRTSCLQKASM
jgi:hypothetical protein